MQGDKPDNVRRRVKRDGSPRFETSRGASEDPAGVRKGRLDRARASGLNPLTITCRVILARRSRGGLIGWGISLRRRSFDDRKRLGLLYPHRAAASSTTHLLAPRAHGHREVHFVPEREGIPALIERLAEPGDVVITMGAGDIWKVGEAYRERVAGKGSDRR